MRIQLNKHLDGTYSCNYKETDIIGGDIALIAYPEISEDKLKEIQEATPDKVQEILSSLTNL